MPTTEYPVWSLFTQSNFEFTDTSYVYSVRARGSGDWVYNDAGFNAGIRFLPDFYDIPSTATIISATAVISAAGTNGTSGTGIDQLSFDAAPGLEGTGPIAAPGSFSDVTFTYPHPLTATQLYGAIIGLGVANVDGLTLCEFVGVIVNWTDEPPADMVAVWCAGARPSHCGRPPTPHFHPIGIFVVADGLEQTITREYCRRFGIPPPGYVLWSYCRTVTTDFVPDFASPIANVQIPF